MKPLDTSILEKIKKNLVKAYNPSEIYLFGPHVWGHPDEDSNLDLLVIVDHADLPRHTLLAQGHKALIDVDMPKNIIVYTHDEFEKRANDNSSLSYKIKHQGQKIYAKA